MWVTRSDLGRITYVNKEHPAYQYFTINDENEIYGYKDSGAKQKALSETGTEGLRVLVSDLYEDMGKNDLMPIGMNETFTNEYQS